MMIDVGREVTTCSRGDSLSLIGAIQKRFDNGTVTIENRLLFLN